MSLLLLFHPGPDDSIPGGDVRRRLRVRVDLENEKTHLDDEEILELVGAFLRAIQRRH